MLARALRSNNTIGTKMKKYVIGMTLTMVVSISAAKDNYPRPAIGGFYLGMTNAQAAKIGLRDCVRKFSYSDIECVPALPPLPGDTEAKIRFDATSRKAVELRVKVVNKVGAKQSPTNNPRNVDAPWSAGRWWTEADSLASIVQARLSVACTSRYKATEREKRIVLDSCYVGDVTQRVRRGYNEVYEASTGRRSGNDPHFQVRLTLTLDGGEKLYRIQKRMAAERAKAEVNMGEFAAGK